MGGLEDVALQKRGINKKKAVLLGAFSLIVVLVYLITIRVGSNTVDELLAILLAPTFAIIFYAEHLGEDYTISFKINNLFLLILIILTYLLFLLDFIGENLLIGIAALLTYILTNSLLLCKLLNRINNISANIFLVGLSLSIVILLFSSLVHVYLVQVFHQHSGIYVTPLVVPLLLFVIVFRRPYLKIKFTYKGLVLSLLFLLIFIPYLHYSVLLLYTPYTDYPRHYRGALRLYMLGSTGYNPLYLGYHSLLAYFVSLVGYDNIGNLAYITLSLLIYVLLALILFFRSLDIKMPFTSLLLYLFSINLVYVFSSLALVFGLNSYYLKQILFYIHEVLYTSPAKTLTMIKPEILGLILLLGIIVTVRLLTSERSCRSNTYRYHLVFAVLFSALTIMYTPLTLLALIYVIIRVSNYIGLKEKRGILIIALAILSMILPALLLMVKWLGVMLLIAATSAIVSVFSYQLLKVIGMIIKNRYQLLVLSISAIIIGVIIYLLELRVTLDNLILYIVDTYLHYLPLYVVPAFMGVASILAVIGILGYKRNYNNVTEIKVDAEYIIACIILIVLFNLFNITPLIDFNLVFSMGLSITYWGFRLLPYCMLFLVPFSVYGLRVIEQVFRNKFKLTSISAMLLTLLILASMAVPCMYSMKIDYEKYISEKITNTELKIIKFLTHRTIIEGSNTSICIIPYSDRLSLVLQYVPANSEIFSFLKRRILWYETNKDIIDKILAQYKCRKYYLVIPEYDIEVLEKRHSILLRLALNSTEHYRFNYINIYVINSDVIRDKELHIRELPGCLYASRMLEANGTVLIKSIDNGANITCNYINVTGRYGNEGKIECINKRIKHYFILGAANIDIKGRIKLGETIIYCEPRELAEMISIVISSIYMRPHVGIAELKLRGYGEWLIYKAISLRDPSYLVIKEVVGSHLGYLALFTLLLASSYTLYVFFSRHLVRRK